MYEKIKRVFAEQYLKNQNYREETIQQGDTLSTIIVSSAQVQLLDLFGVILGTSREVAEWILKDNEVTSEYSAEKSRAD